MTDAFDELPDDPAPAALSVPSKAKPRRPKTVSARGTAGMARKLDYRERMDCWHDWVMGTSVYELAVKYKSSLPRIDEALSVIAGELGYPDRHIDPEMGRFKIVEASERMKGAIIVCLASSDKILRELDAARTGLLGERKLQELPDTELTRYSSLVGLRQSELKAVVTLSAEYRQVNTLISDMIGAKHSRPKRDVKPPNKLEDALAEMSLDEVKRIVSGADRS